MTTSNGYRRRDGDESARAAAWRQMRVAVEANRQDVVERLLGQGLSPAALVALLPDWEPLVGHAAPPTCDGDGPADRDGHHTAARQADHAGDRPHDTGGHKTGPDLDQTGLTP